MCKEAHAKAGHVCSINEGDHRARVLARRDELIETHLGLARSIACGLVRSLPSSFELDDLMQAGAVGLLHAATRYRAELGVPFSAYARKAIRGAILDYVAGRPFHAEEPITEATEPALAPTIDIAIDRERRLERVRSAMRKLRPGEAKVVEMCASGAQIREAAAALGIDRRRAGEAHATALRRLRGMLTE